MDAVERAGSGPQPLVSICIPTYRGAASIGATIESVLAQTLPQFELIIVDDRSPDVTLEVVGRYRDPRIRVVVNERNLGAEGNWNRCLELARGRYYKLLPHDDLLAPDCLREQVDVLEQDTAGEIALVFGWRQVIGTQGRPLMERRLPGHGRGRIAGATLVHQCVRAGTNLIGEPGNGLMRLSTARALGPYNAQQPYVVDLDYWFRALATGDGYYTDRWSSSFRISTGSWTAAIGKRQYADFADFVRRGHASGMHAVGRAGQEIGFLRARVNMALRRLVFRFLH